MVLQFTILAWDVNKLLQVSSAELTLALIRPVGKLTTMTPQTDTQLLFNPLRKFALWALSCPAWLSMRLITWMFRYKVKLVGTAGTQIVATDLQSVTFVQANKRKVQNHIGGVHAAAMALLAESASGFVVGLNLPGGRLPLIKQMNLKYVKRARGALRATAHLSDSQLSEMLLMPKGEVQVAVKVTDEDGNEPVICEMTWAWIEKK